jgi:hypothetical protein
MASVEEYRRQVSGLDVEFASRELSSVAVARDALAQLRRLQKELRQIKRSVNLDMKAIRVEYGMKVSQVGTRGLTGLLAGARGAGKWRAAERRNLHTKRDRILEPYDKLKLDIDSLLVQMDDAKIRVQAAIQALKAEEQEQKRAGKRQVTVAPLCPQCGAPAAEADMFCRWCGQKLDSVSLLGDSLRDR